MPSGEPLPETFPREPPSPAGRRLAVTRKVFMDRRTLLTSSGAVFVADALAQLDEHL
jgi:hypothetical protein